MRVCVGGEPRAVKRSRERDPAGKTRIRAACSVRHQRCGLDGRACAKSTMGVWTVGESDFGSEDYGAAATATVVPDGVVDGFREPYRCLAAGVSCSTSAPQSLRARFRSGYTETTEESFREAYKNEGAVTMPFENGAHRISWAKLPIHAPTLPAFASGSLAAAKGLARAAFLFATSTWVAASTEMPGPALRISNSATATTRRLSYPTGMRTTGQAPTKTVDSCSRDGSRRARASVRATRSSPTRSYGPAVRF